MVFQDVLSQINRQYLCTLLRDIADLHDIDYPMSTSHAILYISQ